MVKTISLTEEVYNLLLNMKLEGESFSDTIARLAIAGGKLSECAGLWSDMPEKELEEIVVGIRGMRRSSDKALPGRSMPLSSTPSARKRV